MQQMIAADARGYITAAAVNLVMSAREQPQTLAAVLNATLAVPDGMPLVWALHALGHSNATRIYGPDLMAKFCARAAGDGTPIYLYGGRHDDYARELLARRLRERFAGLQIAGSSSPPFRPLTTAEDEHEVELINASGAAIVWVGTGQPKQEQWMREMRPRLKPPLLVGVGIGYAHVVGGVCEQPPDDRGADRPCATGDEHAAPLRGASRTWHAYCRANPATNRGL